MERWSVRRSVRLSVQNGARLVRLDLVAIVSRAGFCEPALALEMEHTITGPRPRRTPPPPPARAELKTICKTRNFYHGQITMKKNMKNNERKNDLQ